MPSVSRVASGGAAKRSTGRAKRPKKRAAPKLHGGFSRSRMGGQRHYTEGPSGRRRASFPSARQFALRRRPYLEAEYFAPFNHFTLEAAYCVGYDKQANPEPWAKLGAPMRRFSPGCSTQTHTQRPWPRRHADTRSARAGSVTPPRRIQFACRGRPTTRISYLRRSRHPALRRRTRSYPCRSHGSAARPLPPARTAPPRRSRATRSASWSCLKTGPCLPRSWPSSIGPATPAKAPAPPPASKATSASSSA